MAPGSPIGSAAVLVPHRAASRTEASEVAPASCLSTAKGHAKINLSLDILGRRADGFHEVQTILQPIELGAVVTIRGGPRSETLWLGRTSNDPALLATRRAVMRLFQRVGLCPEAAAARVVVSDNLQVAGGVGASSVAIGPAIRALSDFLGLDLPLSELAAIASDVAADGPFSLQSTTCLATGKGDVLAPLAPMPPAGVILVDPRCAYLGAEKTRKAYALWDRSGLRPSPRTEPLLAARAGGDWRAMAPLLGNAFEPVLFAHFPALAEVAKFLLRCGCFAAHVTGSGPCVYGLCDLGVEREIAARMAASPAVRRVVSTQTVTQ
jgi:4-diphosphocytidyl-2-C-methyl-D-erythritol kinase